MHLQPGIAISPRPTKFGPIMFSGRLNDGLNVLHKNCFKFVELSLRTVEDIDADETNEKLSELGISVTSVATGQAFLFDRLSFGAEELSDRKKAIAHFNAMTLFAKKLNANAMILGGMRGNLSGQGAVYQQNYHNAVAAIRESALFCEENGITLVFEPINRYETNWIHRVQDGLEFLENLNVSSARLLIDTFHMNIEESDMTQAIKNAGEKIGYVHFADNTRYPPGQGQINYRAVLDALEAVDYTGPVVVEALPLPDDEKAVENCAAFWKEMGVSL